MTDPTTTASETIAAGSTASTVAASQPTQGSDLLSATETTATLQTASEVVAARA